MFRRLLNFASVVCFVACVAMMGMWVRSFNGYDELRGHFGASCGFSLASTSGRLMLHQMQIAADDWPWRVISDERIVDIPRGQGLWRRLGFYVRFNWNSANIELPYWFLVLVSGALAAVFRVPWTLAFGRWLWRLRVPRQFTLRSLFVTTTVVAVVLGLAAMFYRAWMEG